MKYSVLPCSCLLVLAASAVAAPPTLESLHRVHQQRAAQLRTVRIVETLETVYPDNPAEAERVAERIRKRADLPLALLLEDLDALGAAPGEVDEAVQGLLDQFGNLEQKADMMARIVRLNRQQRVQRRLWIDFAARRVRSERRDLRDIDGLLRQAGLEPTRLSRANLEIRDTSIATPQYRIWLDTDGRQATFLPAGRTALHPWLEQLGIVPEAYFTARYPHELRLRKDGSIRLLLRYADTDGIAAEVHLRPAPGYEATYFARYSRDGTLLHEASLSDFRPAAADFRVPFRAEIRKLSRAAGGMIRQTHEVQTIQWNPQIDNAAFALPRGAQVRVADSDGYAAYQRLARTMPAQRP